MTPVRTTLRIVVVLYGIGCIFGLLQFGSPMIGRPGVQHDPTDSVLAIALGLPWSLLMGVLLHPDSRTGLAILIVSMGINLSLLAWLARLSSHGLGAGLICKDSLARVAEFAGFAATITWTILAGLTMASTLIRPSQSTLGLTLAVAAVFFTVAAIQFWRTGAVAAVCREAPAISANASLAFSEIVTAAAIFVVGVLLIAAVVSRVFGEGLPLFG